MELNEQREIVSALRKVVAYLQRPSNLDSPIRLEIQQFVSMLKYSEWTHP